MVQRVVASGCSVHVPYFLARRRRIFFVPRKNTTVFIWRHSNLCWMPMEKSIPWMWKDWRLPKIEEWKTVIDPGRQCPALVEPNPFENIIVHMPYWSRSEMEKYPAHAYTVMLYRGTVNHQRKNNRAFIMPVRNVNEWLKRSPWQVLQSRRISLRYESCLFYSLHAKGNTLNVGFSCKVSVGVMDPCFSVVCSRLVEKYPEFWRPWIGCRDSFPWIPQPVSVPSL